MNKSYTIPDFGPSDLLNNEFEGFRRVKTETSTESVQNTLDGFSFITNWVEFDIQVTQSRYALFTVPAGFYLRLNNRIINATGELAWYYVYPEGTFEVDQEIENTVSSFAKTRNLRQDSGFKIESLKKTSLVTPPTPFEDSTVNEPIFGSTGGGIGGNRTAISNSDPTFFMFNPNQRFLLELKNIATSATSIQVQLAYSLIALDKVPKSLI